MGNKNLSLYIKLDDSAYSPGDYIQGDICLKIPSAMRVESLILQLFGVESVHWEDFSGEEKAAIATHQAKNVIIEKALTVYIWSQCLGKKGQYVFPFTIILPNSMPGSFSYEASMIKASIKYYLTATLISTPEPYSLTQEIKLIQPHIEHNSDLSVGCVSTAITGCCMLNYGVLFLRARFDKTSYATDDILGVIVDIDHAKCSINVGIIEVTLFRSMLLRSNDGSQKILKERISQKSVRARTRNSLLINEGLRIPFALANLESEIKEKCTTKGQLINCSYSAHVRTVMDSGCAGPESEVEIWTEIKPKVTKTQHPKPKKWKPVFMPAVRFAPSAPPLEN
ncbi:unnamed protein product [Blepharisma stoltei]|uniref:Arrestin-like N-terminal domain-containing protein n=1 Tax=Blepharisma stoltei TaxID=1481888 RepID=A0AAU9JPF0_9CILI|nr:unnamed protein product [Blepharisma stoltei]